MRRVASACAAMLALGGCGETPPTPPSPASPAAAASPSRPSPAPQPSPAPSAEAPASLVGEWRVAAIDGKPVEAPVGLAVSIKADTISFEPTCAGFIWRYRYAAGRLEIQRSARPDAEGRPPPVCAVSIFTEQRTLATALDLATSATRTPSNGVELGGGGHRALLFSQ